MNLKRIGMILAAIVVPCLIDAGAADGPAAVRPVPGATPPAEFLELSCTGRGGPAVGLVEELLSGEVVGMEDAKSREPARWARASGGISGVYGIKDLGMDGSLYVADHGDGRAGIRIQIVAGPNRHEGEVEAVGSLKVNVASVEILGSDGAQPCRLTVTFGRGQAVVAGADENCRSDMGHNGRMDGTYARKKDPVSGLYASEGFGFGGLLTLDRSDSKLICFIAVRSAGIELRWTLTGPLIGNAALLKTVRSGSDCRIAVRVDGDRAAVSQARDCGGDARAAEGCYVRLP